MPIRGCTVSGKPGYKWGDSDTCYPYTPGDDESRATARKKAAEQGRAIQVKKSYKFEIKKTREDNNLVFGWAYVTKEKGVQVTDHSGEFMDMEDLEMSMYVYNLAFRKGGEVHKGAKNGLLVESMVLTKEKQKALGIAPENYLPEGAWVGLYFPDDKTFQKVKSGEYAMFSIEGLARRKEVE